MEDRLKYKKAPH